MSLLSLSNVTAHYGKAQALFGIDLSLSEGEVLALMGRNGMGKSTTIKVIMRMLTGAGKMRFAGEYLNRLPSHRAAQLGIGLVPEGRRCFSDLTVEENLIASRRKGHWDLARVAELFPRIEERLKQNAFSLSGGEQQMLAIGRALMTNPRLLILDEATEGLAPIIRQEIWAAINQLKAETGLSILVVDKSIKELRGVCDQATIIERGRIVWSDKMNSLKASTLDKYVGVS
jgi:branched-chain amino acid transport system ATP-binding protein